jgi:hypothetical protein
MTEQATDPYAEMEEESAAFLAEGGDDLDARASALIRRLRKVLKQHGEAIERTRRETREQVLDELRTAREQEAAFRRIGAAEAIRPLFAGVDHRDDAAMRARAEELRGAGITWEHMPSAPPPPPPVGAADPVFQAQAAMLAVEAGGTSPGQSGDLAARMEAMLTHPDR